MTEALPPTDRETTAAARRRVAAADRARRWREEHREAELAREAENAALRAEVTALRAERQAAADREEEAARLRAELYAARDELGRLRTHFDTLAKADMVDEDLSRAVVRLAGLRRSLAGPLAVGNPTVAVADIVAAAALIRCGGKEAGQSAYDVARTRVLDRLRMFVPPPDEALGASLRLMPRRSPV
ncbi:hypothetical protein [Methylobacterium platani]|uniref:Uncharacterized protein n=2 Tax=Methylobacterium platani TaxID=427683 RepID=A0A179S5R0_9HYPH|nr:hypothetical protein [Methylobacterium platani]KMO22323.1 hypothetical protein SQ03_00975 [Methylobacterium platani JCM 14648]OAS22535.1 hypothetical protein A5481_19265 [Methylobacterium platani]